MRLKIVSYANKLNIDHSEVRFHDMQFNLIWLHELFIKRPIQRCLAAERETNCQQNIKIKSDAIAIVNIIQISSQVVETFVITRMSHNNSAETLAKWVFAWSTYNELVHCIYVILRNRSWISKIMSSIKQINKLKKKMKTLTLRSL